MKFRKRSELFDAWLIGDIVRDIEDGKELAPEITHALHRLKLRIGSDGIASGLNKHGLTAWLVRTPDDSFAFFDAEVFHRVFVEHVPAKPGPKPKGLQAA